MADLAQLTPAQLTALGSRIRRIAEGRAWTGDEIVAAIVHLLFDEISGSVALVRAFRTRPLAAVSPALQDVARAAAPGSTAATRALVLVAARGNEPAWNDIAEPAGPRVLPLVDGGRIGDAATGAPALLGAVLERLRAADPPPSRPEALPGAAAARPAGAPPAGAALDASSILFIADAVGDPRVPAQREFVLRHGVRSVIGCGGALPDGELFVLLVFATTVIPEAIAGEFDALGVHARLALLDATDHALPAALVATSRAQGLDTLLRLQEYRFQRQAEQLAQDREDLVARAEELRRVSGTRAAQDADRLRRGQRAMLNVIDDLREARSRLEQRVADRTAALEERNRELEQFAYIASHDLQEPLRTVAGYLQLIEQRYAERLDHDAHDFIRFAVEGAQRMQALIEALLAYSRVTSRTASVSQFALDDVVDDALRGLERAVAEASATIERGALPVVRGDRIQLGQLVQNLLANALKFRGEAPAHISITAERDSGHHIITVRDQGIGFDNRHADRIFAVFRRLQRRYPGTGIGLAICKKIVERHGGTIRASASPGQGATFQFTLPMAPR